MNAANTRIDGLEVKEIDVEEIILQSSDAPQDPDTDPSVERVE